MNIFTSSCVDEMELCKGKSFCNDKIDLQWCKNASSLNQVLPIDWKPIYDHSLCTLKPQQDVIGGHHVWNLMLLPVES